MPVLDDVRKIHMAVVASISVTAPNPFASPAQIVKYRFLENTVWGTVNIVVPQTILPASPKMAKKVIITIHHVVPGCPMYS